MLAYFSACSACVQVGPSKVANKTAKQVFQINTLKVYIMNIRIALSTGLIAATLLTTSGAWASDDHYRSQHSKHRSHSSPQILARVIEAQPIYETIRVSVPERTCWTEQVHYPSQNYSRRSYTTPILGGIVGGVIGNRFGRGRGNTAMTVAGTVLGASIANDLSERSPHSRPSHASETVCETQTHYEYREERVGYDVKYRYQGETYWTRMDEHPGKRIPINVSVSPVRYY